MLYFFIKFSGFVYDVEDYCCDNFRNQKLLNMFKKELENCYIFIWWMLKKRGKWAASGRWHCTVDAGKNRLRALASALIYIIIYL